MSRHDTMEFVRQVLHLRYVSGRQTDYVCVVRASEQRR